MDVSDLKDIAPVIDDPCPSPQRLEEEVVIVRRASEKVKRKMKMADLKAFVETKLLSKSEKALEKIGQEDKFSAFHTAVNNIFVIYYRIKQLSHLGSLN